MANQEIARGTLILDTQLDDSKFQAALNRVQANIDKAATTGSDKITSTLGKAFLSVAAQSQTMSDKFAITTKKMEADAAAAGQTINSSFLTGFSGVGKGISSLESTFNGGLNSAISATGKAMIGLGAVGGAALTGFLEKAIRLGVGFNVLQQKTQAALTTILGTSDGAKTLLANINALVDKTRAFPRDALIAASQSMVGFGINAAKVVPILDAIQETVGGIGGSASDIGALAQVFANIQSAGHITGETLREFSIRGVDAAKLIGDAMGKTGEQIRKEISNGAIGADQAIDILTKGLKDKFGGATENISKTFDGAKERIRGSTRDIGAALTAVFIDPTGANGGGAAVKAMSLIVDALKNIQQLAKSKPVQDFLAQIAALAIKGAEAFKQFTASISTDQVAKLLGILEKLAPVLLFIGSTFLKSFTGGIPVIGKLVGTFSPLGGALVLIASKSEAFRKSAENLFKTLAGVGATVLPILQEAFGKLQDAIGKGGASGLDTISEVIKGFAPLFVVAAEAINAMTSALGPLLSALNFGPVRILLELLIAKFALAKITGTDAFKSIATAIGTVVGNFTSTSDAAKDVDTSLKGLKGSGEDVIAGISGGLLTTEQTAGHVTKAFGNLKDAISKTGTGAKGIEDANKALEATGQKLAQNRDAAGRFASGFSEISTSTSKAAAGVESVAASTGKLAAAGSLAKGGLSALAGGLGELLNPIQVVTVGIGFMISRVQGLQNAANKKAASLTASLGLEELNQGKFDQVDKGISDITKKLDDAKKKLNSGAQVSIGGFRIAPFKDVNKDAAQVKALENALKGLKDQAKNVDDVFKGVGATTGRSTAEIAAKAKELGINLENLPADKVAKAITDISKSFVVLSTTINGTVVPSLEHIQELFDAFDAKSKGVFSASDALQSAQAGLQSANDSLASSTASLNKLEAERNALAKDTGARVRELKSAEDALTRTRQKLADLDREQKATQEDLAKLTGQDFADKQASADRDIERAKLALNQALRDQADAQKALTNADKEAVPAAKANLDLTGLSIDQIRRKLVDVRSTLALQKQATAAATAADKKPGAAGKTPAELADEEKKKVLDVADAQQAVKDATQKRAELDKQNAKDIQADQEKLKTIDLDRADATRQLAEQQENLNKIKRGETGISKQIKDLDEQITAGKHAQTAAQAGVTKAIEATKLAEAELRKEEAILTNDKAAQLKAENDIYNLKIAGLDATRKGTVELKNQLALIQSQLGQTTAAIDAANAAAAKVAAFKATLPQVIQGAITNITSEAGAEGAAQLAIRALAQAVADDPAFQKQQSFLATKGINSPGFVGAEGGLIDKLQYPALIGEAGHELLLPLTKPNRVWQLLAEHLPKYPGAFSAAQSALGLEAGTVATAGLPTINLPSTAVAALPRLNLSDHKGRVITPVSEGPMTYGQAQEIIKLLAANGKTDVKIEAPIQVVNPKLDENLLARKVEQRILRALESRLR